MAVDQTIERLVAALRPVRRRRASCDWLVLAAVFVVELALVVGFAETRPMPGGMDEPAVMWRFGTLGLIALGGAAVALSSFDPVRPAARRVRWLVLLAAACLLGGLGLDQPEGGGSLAARLDWTHGLQCVAKMVALSLPPLVALGLLMRRGAAVDPGATALAAGLAASAWGAFVFVFACPYDDPLYIAVWYGMGCGLVTGAARAMLPGLTRW